MATALTDTEIQGFIENGFVSINNAFPKEVAEAGRAIVEINDAPTRILVGSHLDVPNY